MRHGARVRPTNAAQAACNEEPKMNRYRVEIVFTDGTYRRNVQAETPEQAYSLALPDARMASTNPTFYGKVLSHSETQVDKFP